MRIEWEEQETRRHNGVHWVVSLVTDAVGREGTESVSSVELGRIEKRFLTVQIPTTRAFHQGLFWERVRSQLDRLALEASERARLESAIAEKVPLPDGDWALWGVTCIPKFDA